MGSSNMPFVAVLHSGEADGEFDPSVDFVECSGTVLLQALRDNYRKKLVRDGVPPEKARQRAEQVRGASVLMRGRYERLVGSTDLTGMVEESRFHFGARLVPSAGPQKARPDLGPEARHLPRRSEPDTKAERARPVPAAPRLGAAVDRISSAVETEMSRRKKTRE